MSEPKNSNSYLQTKIINDVVVFYRTIHKIITTDLMVGDDSDKFAIDQEDLDMLRTMFGITTRDQNARFEKVIEDVKEEYGYVDKQILVQRLLKEFGVDPEFFEQIQEDIADLNMDHLDHLLKLDFKYTSSCNTCNRQYTELCQHLEGEDRLEILLQMGKNKEGLELLEKLSLPKLDHILWKIRLLIIDHQTKKIKELLDDASQIIYDDDNLFNIFRVQVLKIHYLLDQRRYDEALKVADTISPFADNLDSENSPEVKYWMASLSQGMAAALLKMGQVQVALDPLLASTDLFIEIRNKYQIAISFSLLASVMGILQEGEKTHEAAKISLNLMRSLGNDFGLIRVKTFVASGYLALFETDIANDYAQEALEMALKTDKKIIIAALYGLSAQIQLISCNYEKATEYAENSFEYAKDQGVNEIKAIAISLQGDICAEQNKISEAIELYDKAIDFLEDGKDDQIILDLDRRIVELQKLK